MQNVCASAAENGQKDFDVLSAQSDQIFKDIDALPDSDKDRLPVWKNELLVSAPARLRRVRSVRTMPCPGDGQATEPPM